jgi:DNA-binding CsgD family transcriptional regulator/tetratricopeptide (TPR) repeat protein
VGVGWWAGGVAGVAGFVGREGELSRLRTAVGAGMRLLLVVGDAGVGKTRFAGEGMRRAATGGLVPVWGRCLPLAEKLPLLPVAEALGELRELDGGGLLEAALALAPPYVRVEIGRLLPQRGTGGMDGGQRGGERGEGWRRERLFAAVAELLGAVARRSPVGLVVEDVHWADSATLDCLTYLARAGRGGGAVTVVVTCRGDEAPLDQQVAQWLAHMRGGDAVEELRLGPLSREEAAEQIAGLVGGPPPPRLADDVYARAEGNPFFTEQLVAAALAGPAGGGLRAPAQLPGRLAELLVARAARCGGDGQAVLAALAVAERPLTEALLSGVTELDAATVRAGLRELAAARLLADSPAGAAHRPRHALLAEAVAAALLPGERIALHERTARALGAEDDDTLAAEVAGHWAAAGCPAEELQARVAAAGAAERVFGYAQAAGHWQRAIELCQAGPSAAGTPGAELPRLYVRAIDALEISGDGARAGVLAEEAYRRFAGHPDRTIAAVIHLRAAVFRAVDTPDAGLPLIREALRLFEQAPPSAEHAEAWYRYAIVFFFHGEGRREASHAALTRALAVAEAAGATALISRILSGLAVDAFLRGQVGEGFAALHRGRALAEAAGDGEALLRLAVNESDALLKTGRFPQAAEVARRGLQAARQAGRQASFDAAILANNVAEALLARGRTAEAGAVIDPVTTGPPDRDHWVAHQCRVEIDVLRGDLEAAARRQQQINAATGHVGSIERDREAADVAAELALWAGRPGDALHEVRRALAPFTAPDLTIFCGRLLAAGMRACADLAEQARARRDGYAARDALDAAAGLASWVEQMGGAPFTDHPFVAAIPAERATWEAERTRVTGPGDPAVWAGAGKEWQDLGCPHRAGYAWWRQAQAQLDTGQPPAAAAAALRAAAAAADGHVPLLAQVRTLAERARIPLQTPAAAAQAPPQHEARAPYGLTGRELAVLRLVAAGRSNAQIGAELYISRATASVHVTSILRKLGVTNRVQAATLAERAGLLDTQP